MAAGRNHGYRRSGSGTEKPAVLLAGYLGSEKTVKLPGKVDGVPVRYIGGLQGGTEEDPYMESDPSKGVLLKDNKTTTKVIIPCTMKMAASANSLWKDELEEADYMTYVLPSDMEIGMYCFGGGMGGQVQPNLNIVVQKGTKTCEEMQELAALQTDPNARS